MSDYNITLYPEGFEKVRDEELGFLPEDRTVRDLFMIDLLQWLVQW